MALAAIKPLNYETFIEKLGDFPEQIIDVLENNQQYGDWWKALQRYEFNGMNYVAGIEIRNSFHKKLTRTTNRFGIANEILQWGKMKPLNKKMRDNLERNLRLLGDEKSCDLNLICADRIASISKIYEMWNPSAWIIYDSYCAKGLQWLVSQLWQQNGVETHADILRFPWPPGRVGAPIEGFVRLGTQRQARLGFIYVSWLCRAIAAELNKKEKNEVDWRAYHIEMVAFQIGHEI